MEEAGIILDHDAAVRRSNFMLHNVEGKATLFPRNSQSQSEESSHGQALSQHCGHSNLGLAVKCKVVDAHFPVMIAYVSAKQSGEDPIPGSFPLRPIDVNVAARLFDERELLQLNESKESRKNHHAVPNNEYLLRGSPKPWEKEHNVTVGRRRSYSLPSYNNISITNMGDRQAAHRQLRKDAENGLLKNEKPKPLAKPLEKSILREITKLSALRIEYTTLSSKTLEWAQWRFRLVHRWNISLKKLKRVVYAELQACSMGTIPVGEQMVATAAESEAKDHELHMLPQRMKDKADQETKSVKDPTYKAKAKRVFKPRHFADDIVTSKPAQRADVEVHMNLFNDPNVDAYIRLRHLFYYIDDSVDKQPKHRSDIFLNYRNTRVETPPAVGKEVDNYHPSHDIIDVSAKSNMNLLHRLFPHKSLDYFTELRGTLRSGNGLYLLSIRQNNLPHTENVFVEDKNMPPDHTKVKKSMRMAPTLLILVRSHNIQTRMASLIERFRQLARNDPLLDFFVDPYHTYISEKNVVPMSQCPKFSARSQYTFATFWDYYMATGLSALFEHRSQGTTAAYQGKAAFFPIVGSFNKFNQLHMAYMAFIYLDRASKQLPALTPGDRVNLLIGSNLRSMNDDPFRGKVMPATAASAMGQLKVSLWRPVKDGNVVRIDEIATIPENELTQLSNKELIHLSRQRCDTDVTFFSEPDRKELKRVMKALDAFHLPKSQADPGVNPKAAVMEQHKLLLRCTDHESLPQSGLWDLVERLPDTIHNDICSQFKPGQYDVVQKLVNKGLRDNTAVIMGPSGTGKTTTVLHAVKPFLVAKVRMPLDEHIRREEEIEEFLGGIVKSQLEVDEKSASEENAATHLEAGRLTFASATNTGVDKLFLKVESELVPFCTKHGYPPPLIIRKHSDATEENAAQANSHPDRATGPEPSIFLDDDQESGNDIVKVMRRDWKRNLAGSSHFGVRDPRYKLRDHTLARYVLEIAGHPSFPESSQLRNVFTSEEITQMRHKLQDLLGIESMLLDSHGIFTKEMKKIIKNAMKIGSHWLLRRASVIVTTSSIANEESFAILRKAHVLVIEEASRLSEAQTWGFFSLHHGVPVRILLGDHKQLGPALFGSGLENNFHSQGKIPLLMRLYATGFPVQFLEITHRFGNTETLELCQLANDLPKLAAFESATRPEETKLAKEVHVDLYRKAAAVVVVDVEDSKPKADQTGSWYNIDSALCVMQDLKVRIKKFAGVKITYLTEYNAQLELVRMMLRHLEDNSKKLGDPNTAYEFASIHTSTVDSYMGEENTSIVLDIVRPGHIMELPRTVVALTRASVSCTLVCSSWEVTSSSNKEFRHPFKNVIRACARTGRLCSITPQDREHFYQYREVLESFGFM